MAKWGQAVLKLDTINDILDELESPDRDPHRKFNTDVDLMDVLQDLALTWDDV